MLKKLKLKFILINMILVTAVLIVVFLITYFTTYQLELTKIDNDLQDTITAYNLNNRPGGMPSILDRDLPNRYVFSVSISNNNHRINRRYAVNSELDEEQLYEIINLAMNSGENDGILSDHNLAFKIVPTDYQTHIAFASLNSLNQTMQQTVIITSISLIAVLILLFIVSYLLSSLAIKPIAENLKKQKQFIADASHDLKTPLTVILANTNIIMEHPDETVESQMQWIESTKEESEKLKSMTNKLLELAQSENIKNKLNIETVNLSDVCHKLLLQFEPIAFDKNISIDETISDEIFAKTDLESISRLLSILLDNAIKYCDEKGTVSVSLIDNKHNIEFSVNNTGSIIPKEDLPHVFERFYRADKVRNVGGHGLGLAIAKNLADSMNHKLIALSEEETGTTFIVQIKK